MRLAVHVAVAALLVFGGSAQPYHHSRHQHGPHDAATPLKRAVTTVVEQGPVVTVYQVAGGGLLSSDEAEKGLQNGEYFIVGSAPAGDNQAQGDHPQDPSHKGTVMFYAAPYQSVESQTGVSTSPGASESSSSQDSSMSPTSSASSVASGATHSPLPPQAVSNSMTKFDGVDREFPDNTYDCDKLPGGFGVVSADRLNMRGWLGIQWGWNDIKTGVSGDTCTPGAYCTYLCPEGYEKAQWPERQGDTGQSIGGLYCNSNNKLVKTRKGASTLCQKGQGGVRVTSSLSETVFMCRTDYPGTEAMLIPISVEPGSTHEVTNPLQTNYLWQGKKTSAQYYINNKGLSQSQACTWDSDHINIKSAGDKAPTNFGTGVDNGITYFSLFPNAAVSKAVLNFNVRIRVNGKVICTLIKGKYSQSDTGCTGGAYTGDDVQLEFYE